MKTSRSPLLLAFVSLTLMSTFPLPGSEPAAKPEKPASADAPLVGEEIRQLMQDRNYPEAITAIEEAAKAEDAPKDYLAYLKGRALYLQKRYDEAADAFEGLQKEFPDSPWTRRARFGKALALARKGDFRRLWITRINAAARQHGTTYSRLIAGLKAAEIEVDRKMLAEIAVNDPDSFRALVAAATEATDG